MAVSTLSFLIIHKDYQDSVTYDVEEDFSFENVIDHICSVFHFDPELVQVKSSLGLTINDLSIKISEAEEIYGTYFRLVALTRDELLEEWVPVKGSVYDQQNEQIQQKEQTVNPEQATPASQPTQSQSFHDVLDNLFLINSENWAMDEKGRVEITIIPRLNSYVTQLKVIYDSKLTVSQLFTNLAGTLNTSISDIIFTPLLEGGDIIEPDNTTVLQLLEQYGAAFVVYPTYMREQVENNSEYMTDQIRKLINKYKRA